MDRLGDNTNPMTRTALRQYEIPDPIAIERRARAFRREWLWSQVKAIGDRLRSSSARKPPSQEV